MISDRLNEFINFHEGTINKLLHIAGFSLLGLGIVQKSLFWVVVGGVTQELGHFYQYYKTKRPQDNPLLGIRSQSIFAIPLFILIVLYVYFAKQ